MDFEKELKDLLDKYKNEKNIEGIYYKDKGLFDNSYLWLLLFLLVFMNGFGTIPNITNIYTDKQEEVKE
jgi:hypothetical protein